MKLPFQTWMEKCVPAADSKCCFCNLTIYIMIKVIVEMQKKTNTQCNHHILMTHVHEQTENPECGHENWITTVQGSNNNAPGVFQAKTPGASSYVFFKTSLSEQKT